MAFAVGEYRSSNIPTNSDAHQYDKYNYSTDIPSVSQVMAIEVPIVNEIENVNVVLLEPETATKFKFSVHDQ